MVKDKPQRRKRADLSAVGTLLSELKEFAEELDVTDPGWTEVMLDTHISNLIGKGTIKAPRWRKNLRLDDVFDLVFRDEATDDLRERVQMFQDLTNTYRGEPDREDMEEATSVLSEIIERVSAYLEKAKNAHAQT